MNNYKASAAQLHRLDMRGMELVENLLQQVYDIRADGDSGGQRSACSINAIVVSGDQIFDMCQEIKDLKKLVPARYVAPPVEYQLRRWGLLEFIDKLIDTIGFLNERTIHITGPASGESDEYTGDMYDVVDMHIGNLRDQSRRLVRQLGRYFQ